MKLQQKELKELNTTELMEPLSKNHLPECSICYEPIVQNFHYRCTFGMSCEENAGHSLCMECACGIVKSNLSKDAKQKFITIRERDITFMCLRCPTCKTGGLVVYSQNDGMFSRIYPEPSIEEFVKKVY